MTHPTKHGPNGPVFHLIHLAQEVRCTESVVTELTGDLEHRLTRIRRSLTEGTNLNSLGELQSTAPALDVAIGCLEFAARAFSDAYRHTREFIPLSDLPDVFQEMLDREVAQSTRLQKEIAK